MQYKNVSGTQLSPVGLFDLPRQDWYYGTPSSEYFSFIVHFRCECPVSSDNQNHQRDNSHFDSCDSVFLIIIDTSKILLDRRLENDPHADGRCRLVYMRPTTVKMMSVPYPNGSHRSIVKSNFRILTVGD